MIDLTDQDVAEFRELYRKQTGRDLSDDQARAYARSIVRFVALLLPPRKPLSEPADPS